MPGDDVPAQVVRLSVELLRSDGIPELMIVGAWKAIANVCRRGGSDLGALGLELDFCGLAVAHLRAMGSAGDWVVSASAVFTSMHAPLQHPFVTLLF